MNGRKAQVGWTDAQWNRVGDEVLREWQRVRVAGSFLPASESVPPSTQVIPSEPIRADGAIDERSTAPLLQLALPVVLSQQQVLEEDLSSAIFQFKRRAAQIAQLEDWFIFNGTYPHEGVRFPGDIGPTIQVDTSLRKRCYRPRYRFLAPLVENCVASSPSASVPIATRGIQIAGLRLRNPGALGLFGASANESATELPAADLTSGIVEAMTKLESEGYVAPYACVLGRDLFKQAHKAVGVSLSFPRDRLEPLIGRELLHSSAIDVPPDDIGGVSGADAWERRGVLLSLAGEAVDLVLATEASPEFRHVDAQGRFVFAVVERLALRIRDPQAIVALVLKDEAHGGSTRTPGKAPLGEVPPNPASGLRDQSTGPEPLPSPARWSRRERTQEDLPWWARLRRRTRG